MNEEDRKLALRQAKGPNQKKYVQELLRGPIRTSRYYFGYVGESGISYWSKDTVDLRLRDAGFQLSKLEFKSGNNYILLEKKK